MAELQFYLLGQFQVCWDFVPVKESVWRVPGSRQLLQLLLGHRPGAVPAEDASRLLHLSPEALDVAVLQLQKVLGEAAAVSRTADGYQLALGPQTWVDADSFRSHYRAGVAATSRGEMLPAIMAFQEADALYQGDYLEEMHGAWVEQQRAEYQHTYTEILDRLAEGHAVLARYQDAIGFCHKALVRDPLREATYQRMMVYYYYLGAHDDAEEAYRQCVAALGEAGRSVSAETESLRDQLRRQALPSDAQREAAAARENTRRESRKSSNNI